MTTQHKSEQELSSEIQRLRERVAELERGWEAAREKAERLTREAESLKVALKGCPLVVFTHDRQLRYERIYSAHPDMPAEKMVGKTDADLFPPEEARRLMQIKRRVLETGVEACEETKVTIRNKEYVYFKSAVPIRDDAGKIVGITCACFNITERKRAEEALRESEARYRSLSEHLEEAVRKKALELQQAQSLAAVGQVVAVVAHDLKNPIQNLQLGVELLRRELSEDVAKLEVLQDMEYGVDLLNKIVGDLLEYSGPFTIRRSRHQVRHIIERALNMMSLRLEPISVRVNVRHEQKEVYLDAGKITRVLMNLIANAIDAMPQGGTLSIDSECHRQQEREVLTLRITDTGQGIAPEHLQRVGEPFFTTKTTGAGLGLAICRNIVEAHRGKMTIQSEVGKGTSVEIMLPLMGDSEGNLSSA